MDPGRLLTPAGGAGPGRSRPVLPPGVDGVGLWDLLAAAQAVRRRQHPATLELVSPRRTLPVSVTGQECALGCRHCGGHYLKAMVPAPLALAEYERRRSQSCLVSGGCRSDGSVPVTEQLELLRVLKARRARLNLHVGLPRPGALRALSGLADAISLDLVGDDHTVREVYGLDRPARAYFDAYLELREEFRVFPHLCLGLHGGELRGEGRVLEWLEAAGAPALVLLVLRPTAGTAYASRTPPAVGAVVRFLAEARLRLPSTRLYLGCMRPGGDYRRALDGLAVWAGVQKVVQPAPSALEQARGLGLELTRGEECCVL